MRLATWNVNSVTARLPRLLGWLEEVRPDVACLQELKCDPADFPYDECSNLGYEAAVHADGRWNGVAVLSRVGLDDVQRGFPGQPGHPGPETRAVSALCAGVRVWSVYVPNGRSLDDPHYDYKLRWLEVFREALADQVTSALVVAGDFNIAPQDRDVWDASLFVDATHVSAPERTRLAALQDLGLEDLMRRRWPDDIFFTYWDYRAGMFHTNRGMRIDLVLATPDIAGRTVAAFVDRKSRKGKGPSDHAPVVVDLDTAPDGDIGPMVPPPSAQGSRPAARRTVVHGRDA